MDWLRHTTIFLRLPNLFMEINLQLDFLAVDTDMAIPGIIEDFVGNANASDIVAHDARMAL
jgi:hypothetical protein